MKNIRIGNDIVVAWSILRDGAPFSLEGKDVTIYLKSPFKKEKVEDFSITGNRVSWTFFGKDQKALGKYALELVVNEDAEGMITTDFCGFVNLVSCSCKEGGEDDGNVATESIALTSNIYLAGSGEGGGGSYDDTAVKAELARLEKDKADKAELTELSAELGKKVDADKVATINGQSLVNGGDITIEGGKGEKGDKGDKGDQGNSGYAGAADELEVVNNLTQGGATAALSAEMGKVLAQDVSNIRTASYIKKIEDSEYLTGIMRNEGAIYAAAGKHCILPLVPNEKIVVSFAQGWKATNSSAVIYLAEDNSVLGTYPSDTTQSETAINYECVPPIGCAKIVVNQYGATSFVYRVKEASPNVEYHNLGESLNGGFRFVLDDSALESEVIAGVINNNTLGATMNIYNLQGYQTYKVKVTSGERYYIKTSVPSNVARNYSITTSDNRVLVASDSSVDGIVTMPIGAEILYVGKSSAENGFIIRRISQYKPLSDDFRKFKWAVVGDSLTDESINARLKYYTLLNINTGIQVQMLGVGGTGYWREYISNKSFASRCATIEADTDIVTIFGSINDWVASSPPNNISNGNASDTLADGTLCGYMNDAIDKAMAAAPNAVIVIFSAMYYKGISESRQGELFQCLKSVAEYRMLPFVDMLHTTMFNRIKEEQFGLEYTTDYSATAGAYGHPNNKAHNRIIAPRFLDALRKYLPLNPFDL